MSKNAFLNEDLFGSLTPKTFVFNFLKFKLVISFKILNKYWNLTKKKDF